jgi:hypothetical protein
VILLGGVGLSFGAYASYRDQHSGTPGKATVTSCTGHDGRYETGLRCTGHWTTGGSLLDGGQLAMGRVDNANRGDIGKTVAVRIHGTDHATIPKSRVSIILALLGLPMTLFGAYLLFTSSSRSSRANTTGSAAS